MGFVDRQGRVHPVVTEAMARGLRIDVGHGSHFSFDVARRVLDAGIVPDTLGADLHGYNTRVPRPAGTPPGAHPDPELHPFAGGTSFSLARAMTGLMACGLRLEQVVPMVTRNAARLARAGTASWAPSARASVADVTVLDDRRGRFRLRDNGGTEVVAERLPRPPPSASGRAAASRPTRPSCRARKPPRSGSDPDFDFPRPRRRAPGLPDGVKVKAGSDPALTFQASGGQ